MAPFETEVFMPPLRQQKKLIEIDYQQNAG
jgi:hypothetical protein